MVPKKEYIQKIKKGEIDMEKDIVEKSIIKEINKNLKIYERIFIRLHKNIAIKVYKLGITYGFNSK